MIIIIGMAKSTRLEILLITNLRIGIFNEEMLFNRLLGNGWPDLDDFSADPHEISISMKC